MPSRRGCTEGCSKDFIAALKIVLYIELVLILGWLSYAAYHQTQLQPNVIDANVSGAEALRNNNNNNNNLETVTKIDDYVDYGAIAAAAATTHNNYDSTVTPSRGSSTSEPEVTQESRIYYQEMTSQQPSIATETIETKIDEADSADRAKRLPDLLEGAKEIGEAESTVVADEIDKVDPLSVLNFFVVPPRASKDESSEEQSVTAATESAEESASDNSHDDLTAAIGYWINTPEGPKFVEVKVTSSKIHETDPLTVLNYLFPNSATLDDQKLLEQATRELEEDLAKILSEKTNDDDDDVEWWVDEPEEPQLIEVQVPKDVSDEINDWYKDWLALPSRENTLVVEDQNEQLSESEERPELNNRDYTLFYPSANEQNSNEQKEDPNLSLLNVYNMWRDSLEASSNDDSSQRIEPFVIPSFPEASAPETAIRPLPKELEEEYVRRLKETMTPGDTLLRNLLKDLQDFKETETDDLTWNFEDELDSMYKIALDEIINDYYPNLDQETQELIERQVPFGFSAGNQIDSSEQDETPLDKLMRTFINNQKETTSEHSTEESVEQVQNKSENNDDYRETTVQDSSSAKPVEEFEDYQNNYEDEEDFIEQSQSAEDEVTTSKGIVEILTTENSVEEPEKHKDDLLDYLGAYTDDYDFYSRRRRSVEPLDNNGKIYTYNKIILLLFHDKIVQTE